MSIDMFAPYHSVSNEGSRRYSQYCSDEDKFKVLLELLLYDAIRQIALWMSISSRHLLFYSKSSDNPPDTNS